MKLRKEDFNIAGLAIYISKCIFSDSFTARNLYENSEVLDVGFAYKNIRKELKDRLIDVVNGLNDDEDFTYRMGNIHAPEYTYPKLVDIPDKYVSPENYICRGVLHQYCRLHRKFDDKAMNAIKEDICNRIYSLLKNGMLINFIGENKSGVIVVPAKSSVEGTPLGELNLHPRTYVPLYNHGIKTVEALTELTNEQVLTIHGIGPGGLREIEDALEERGLELEPSNLRGGKYYQA